MGSLLLAPHSDDESLFAAYSCMRTHAHIIICSYDDDRAVREIRALETTAAIGILGCSSQVWQVAAADLTRAAAETMLHPWTSTDHVGTLPERVYAPAVEQDGHEQHNLIGEVALELFGDKVIPYLTYAPRGQRSRNGTEVVPTTEEIQRKLRALACYKTQIENPATRPWFFDLLDLREWTA